MLGMKASRREMKFVRGETAGTGAKVIDIEYTTVDMAENIEEMGKTIEDMEGAIGNIDRMIEGMSEGMSDFSRRTDRKLKDLVRRVDR